VDLLYAYGSGFIRYITVMDLLDVYGNGFVRYIR